MARAHKTPKTAKSDKASDKMLGRRIGTQAIATGAAVLGLGGALVALIVRARAQSNPAEHAAPDLATVTPRPGADDRAPEAFRPDPTAVPTKAEYDSLRPATGPAKGFAVDRGSSF